jgi:hypothetical protein
LSDLEAMHWVCRSGETDEMFQNTGKKGEWHGDPQDPPRWRANKQRGRCTYDNDRPPVCAVIGRESRQVRIRVMKNTQVFEDETLFALSNLTVMPDDQNAICEIRFTLEGYGSVTVLAIWDQGHEEPI